MILEAVKLSKTYGKDASEVTALAEISLKIVSGEFAAIMGPSGSGKSTLLHLMGGLDSPTSGQVLLDGIDITAMSENDLARVRRRKIGFIFQAYNLFPVLTAEENIALPLLMDNRGNSEIEKRTAEVVKITGLGKRKNHRPSQLSGGEQQRVAIARALVKIPALSSRTSRRAISIPLPPRILWGCCGICAKQAGRRS